MYLAIPNYEGHYSVSRQGRVYSHKSKKLLRSHQNNRSYRIVDLCKDGIPKKYLVHRLVAQTYIPNPENKSQINHKNGIKTDNRVENLEWVTNQENRTHALANGIIRNKGENAPMSKLTNKEAEELRKLRIAGFTFKKLGYFFGICPQAAHQIFHRKTYKYK